MKLVLTGDIHLGRSSSRIPYSVDREQLRSVNAWLRLVDLAIREKADLLCLSGDIADQANKFWESVGPLKTGIKRLARNGIQTVAVAGNHDYDVLPGLADQLPSESFKLLGRDGKWEKYRVELKNGDALNLHGWSFPRKMVTTSPLESYDLSTDPNEFTLGIIHGDLNSPNSPYAPLSLAELQSLGSGNWLLGHIHAPTLISSLSWVLYPGSPQALDPGETGPHGPWIAVTESGRISTPVQVPLSTVWYADEDIDLSDVSDSSEFQSIVLEKIQSTGMTIMAEAGASLMHTSLRINLTGQTVISHIVETAAEEITSDLLLTMGKGTISVERVQNRTIPKIDLIEFSKNKSAAGAVAGLLLELEKKHVSESVDKLIQLTLERLKNAENSGRYASLQRREVTSELARKYLIASSRALLTELTGQIDG